MQAPLASEFEVRKDELAVARESSEFLGHPMYWSQIEQMPRRYIYQSSSVEYRNMKLALFELIFFVVTLAVSTSYLLSQTDVYSESQLQGQQREYWLGSASRQVRDIPSFYAWMKTEFVPRCFSGSAEYSALSTEPPEDWAGQTETTEVWKSFTDALLFAADERTAAWKPRYVGDSGQVVLMGSIRVRQVVVRRNKGCTVHDEDIAGVESMCFPRFMGEFNEYVYKEAKTGTPDSALPAFVFQYSNTTLQTEIPGISNTIYTPNGYTVDLPLSKAEASSLVDTLQEWNWLDEASRAVVIELSVLNSNTGRILNNRLLFEFGPEGDVLVSSHNLAIPVNYLSFATFETDDINGFVLSCVFAAIFMALNLYIVFLIYKGGVATYFGSLYNTLDVLQVILFWVVFGNRVRITNVFSSAPELAPMHAGNLQTFMPYSVFQHMITAHNNALALLLLCVYLKSLKYVTAVSDRSRTPLRVYVRSLQEIATFMPLMLVIFAGLALAFYTGFPGEFMFATFGRSFYAMFYTWAYNTPASDAVFARDETLATVLVVCFVLFSLLMYSVVLGVLIDVTTQELNREALLMEHRQSSSDPNTARNPLILFLYSFYHQMKGTTLMKEPHEDVGDPDEQWIELSLLPGVVGSRWRERRSELIELYKKSVKELQQQKMDKKNNWSLWHTSKSSITSGTSGFDMSIMNEEGHMGDDRVHMLHHAVISRIQLQRLIDSESDLQQVLNSKKAIDVIRRFRAPRGKGKPTDAAHTEVHNEITRLQGDIINKLDAIKVDKSTARGLDGNAKTGIHFEETESMRLIAEGLNSSLSDIEMKWRVYVTDILEGVRELGKQVKEIVVNIERVQISHSGLAQALLRAGHQ